MNVKVAIFPFPFDKMDSSLKATCFAFFISRSVYACFFLQKKKKKKRQKSHFIKTFLRGMCTHTHTIFHPALPIHFRCYQQTFNEVFFIWFATQKLTWHTAFIIYNSFFFFFIRHMTANPRSFSVQWKLIDYWQVPRFKMSITSWSFLLHLFNANLRSEVLLKGKR